MYGYASELLPYLQGLLGSDAQAAPSQDMPGAMANSPNIPMPPRRSHNMSSGHNVPMPMRRPAGLLGGSPTQMPQMSDQDAIAAFLASRGIGQQQQMGPPMQQAMPRIDNGPAAQTPMGPTLQAPMVPPDNPPLPTRRPNIGPPMPMGLQGLSLPRGGTTMSQGPGPTMQSNTPEDPHLAWLHSQLYGGL